jgi:hypothetical protein
MEFLIAALSLGILSSLHCIGMCGPIALALPVHQMPPGKKLLSILHYNLGRVITYATLGALFGMIGQTFRFFGFQQILSIVIGVLILVGLFASKLPAFAKLGGRFYKPFSALKNKIAALFRKKTFRSFLAIGFLNGLLPCGMVYVAIAGAAATGMIYKGALFMAAFGIGTLPLMAAASYYIHLAGIRARNIVRKAVPVTVAIMAIMFIMRGAGLGLGFISPRIIQSEATSKEHKPQLQCCHKN